MDVADIGEAVIDIDLAAAIAVVETDPPDAFC
jgi:hypothetical protein